MMHEEEAYPKWTIPAGVILLILGASGIWTDIVLIYVSSSAGPGNAIDSIITEAYSLSQLQTLANYLIWVSIRHALELGLDVAAVVLAALFLQRASVKLWILYLVLGSSIVLSIIHLVVLSLLDRDLSLAWLGTGVKSCIVLFIYYSNKRHALPS